jgi:integrase
VFQSSRPAQWDPKASSYGRFWVDTPDGRKQKTISLGVCRTRSLAQRKLFEYIESTGVNNKDTFIETTSPAITFRQQSERWLSYMATRRRKPVKAATIYGWRHSLNKWLLPILGDVSLADVGNAALKRMVEKMAAAGLAPQSIVSHSRVVKMVVASAVNDEGERIYPRTWNHDFCGIPIVDPTKQHRPTVARAELETILADIKPKYAALVSLLAGTGLRIGEALGLKVTDLSPDCQVLNVQRSVWQGREQEPKTPNAVRVVDIPEQLAQVLRELVDGKSGYLFATRDGKPLQPRNVLRNFHIAGAKFGFHALRRFRAETLRRARVPEDLIRLWLGHAARSMTDIYAVGLRDDQAWRQEWCERAGLGFQLGHVGTKNVLPINSVKVA